MTIWDNYINDQKTAYCTVFSSCCQFRLYHYISNLHRFTKEDLSRENKYYSEGRLGLWCLMSLSTIF